VDEPVEWLTVREAAQRLAVTEPRLRRAIERTGTGILRETETRTGTRPGVCVRVSDLPALLAEMETGTSKERKRKRDEPEQEAPRVITFAASPSEPDVLPPRSALPPSPESAQVLAANLEHQREINRLLDARNLELQRLLALAEEREQRQAEQLSAALQAVANQQTLAALIERRALAAPDGLELVEQEGSDNGKKNGREAGCSDGCSRPVVARMRVKVSQWRQLPGST
jgi:hypothetical protein